MSIRLILGAFIALSLGLTVSAAPKGPRKAVFGPGGNEASLKACCEFTGKAHPKTLMFETPAGDDEGTIKRRLGWLKNVGADVEVIRMWKEKVVPVR